MVWLELLACILPKTPFLPRYPCWLCSMSGGRGGYVGEQEAPRDSPPCLPPLFAPSGPWECTEIPKEGMC